MKKPIEALVAEKILEKHSEIEIGGRVFSVAQPSFATLIEVSGLISKLPSVSLNKTDFITEVFYIGKELNVIGEIIATMILGVQKKSHFKKSIIDELSSFILKQEPLVIKKILIEMISKMQLYEVFEITTSLLEVNLLRSTRGVV